MKSGSQMINQKAMRTATEFQALTPRISPQNAALSAPYTHPVRAPLPYVTDQLGHASISMTVDVYGHLVPGANRAAMDRLPTVENPVEESLEETAARSDGH